VDNAKEPSSDSPANPETVVIKGEAGVSGAAWVCTEASMAAANRANVMSVRLQLMCSSPLDASGNTFATNADATLTLPSISIANQMNIIFYNSSYYPAQSAIAVVPTGGAAGALEYTADSLPAGVTMNATTGVLTFDRMDDSTPAVPLAGALAPVSGRYAVAITVTDSADDEATATVFISIDNGTGSSNSSAPPA
jgi:hypothetical protein